MIMTTKNSCSRLRNNITFIVSNGYISKCSATPAVAPAQQ